jgi:hypothetical protein
MLWVVVLWYCCVTLHVFLHSLTTAHRLQLLSLERIVPTGPHTTEIRYQYLFVNPPAELGDAEKHAIDTSAEVGGYMETLCHNTLPQTI